MSRSPETPRDPSLVEELILLAEWAENEGRSVDGFQGECTGDMLRRAAAALSPVDAAVHAPEAVIHATETLPCGCVETTEGPNAGFVERFAPDACEAHKIFPDDWSDATDANASFYTAEGLGPRVRPTPSAEPRTLAEELRASMECECVPHDNALETGDYDAPGAIIRCVRCRAASALEQQLSREMALQQGRDDAVDEANQLRASLDLLEKLAEQEADWRRKKDEALQSLSGHASYYANLLQVENFDRNDIATHASYERLRLSIIAARSALSLGRPAQADESECPTKAPGCKGWALNSGRPEPCVHSRDDGGGS